MLQVVLFEGRNRLLVNDRLHEAEVQFAFLWHEDIHVVFVVGVRKFHHL